MYGVDINHTRQDLVDGGNGALITEALSKKITNTEERVPYFEIGETYTQLPNI
jgi:hypothetical protein